MDKKDLNQKYDQIMIFARNVLAQRTDLLFSS